MTRTEKAYAQILDTMKANGEILEWWFELVTLKLAPDCRYTPDFMVMVADGTIEFHETKGSFILDEKGLVKARMAAGSFPFVFVIAQQLGKKDGYGWKIKTLKAE